MEQDINETEDEIQITNIILNNGCNLIAELVFMDEHFLILNRPVEIKKRPQYSSDAIIFEEVTTSPFLIMTEDTKCTVSSHNVLTRNWLHPSLYSLYGKLANKYYISIPTANDTTPSTPTSGTLH